MSRREAAQNNQNLVLDLSRVNRETALKTWLIYNDITSAELAGRLGVAASTISRIVRGDRATPHLVKALREMGIPEELLPVPGRSPGRPKKR